MSSDEKINENHDESIQSDHTPLLTESLASTQPVSEEGPLLPEEIAEDPVAAESFNIEKHFLSVAVDKINSPSAINVSGIPEKKKKEDSFDWLGDDRDLYENNVGFYTGPPGSLTSKTTLYDNIQPDNPQAISLDSRHDHDEGDSEPDDEESKRQEGRFYLFLAMIFQLSLITVSALGVSGYDLGSFGGMAIHYWSILGLLICSIPMVASWSVAIVTKTMRHSNYLDGSEVPNYIEALRSPLILLVTTVIVFSYWFEYFPNSCPPSENPLEVCWYNFAGKVFYALLLFAFSFGLETSLVFNATLRFHERTYRKRIIDCRFKIYVVQQLALKGLQAESDRRQRFTSSQPPSTILSEVSHSHYGFEEQGERNRAPTYIGEICKIFKRLFTTSTIIHGSQQAIGNAANYVQIQVEDQPPSVPVAHAASQSYAKFSKKLNKHMQLYGYSQFAENKAELREFEARLLARDLFNFLGPSGKERLEFSHLAPCFATIQAAKDAFDIFDQDQDGYISKREFRNTIVSIYAELRDVTKSIKSAATTLNKLDVILKICFLIFVLLAVLTLFSVNVTNILTFSLSLIIGLNFIFGHLAQNLLNSMVLLFVNHPFDIGDTIVVGLFEEGVYVKDTVTVKHINLMNTVFTRWNGQETYIPNHMLANAPFMANLTRSVEQWEKIDFSIPTAVPESKITQLREQVGVFLAKHEKDYFKVFDLHAIVAADLGNAEKSLEEMDFTLRVKCKPTSDSQKRWVRHARLLRFVKSTLEKSLVKAH